MKVKYGRGRNAREYEAKILEVGTDSGPRQYLVHYQGWNNRHDEWIKLDRIVKVLERPDSSGKKNVQKPSPKPGLKGPKKKGLSEKQPASPSSVKSDSSTNQGTGRSTKSTKQQTQSGSNGNTVTPPASKGRPTRSNSIESKMSEGLPAKRRNPRAPSINEYGNGSDSENSEKSDNESEADKKPDIEEKEETPTPSASSSSMPLIVSKKNEEVDLDVDPNLDRSPPKLSKVTDLTKEKGEAEERVEEVPVKIEVKEEPVAPILKVESEKNSEPILQKIEAQLNATTTVKSSAIVSEDKEKDSKKKDIESRRVKKTLKEKSEVESSPKKTVDKTNKEEKTQTKELPKAENVSAYEFKDEPVDKMEIKEAEPKKEVIGQKQEDAGEVMEVTKDDSSVVNKVSDEEMGKNIKSNLIVEEREAAKSDSEVERRGRKKKIVNKEESPRDAKKPKVTAIENKVLDAPNLIEKKAANVQSERKPFVTLAEKKQGFSPIVRKVPIVVSEKCVPQESTSDNVTPQTTEKDKVENKEEIKKKAEMVVVHKESSVKSDIIVGRKTEIASQEEEDYSKVDEAEVKDERDESLNDSQTIKKKVRKKTKKKGEDDTASIVKKTVKTRALSAKVKESVKKVKDTPKLSEDESAIKESAIDIDLRCEESIRSRSASPELVENTNTTMSHPESQGFEFFVETVASQLHEGQQSSSGLHLREDKSKSIKSHVYENTPPTTPEHDSDEASQLNNQSDQIKVNDKISNKELGAKLDTGPNEGHESPRGNVSPSSNGSGGSSGIIAGSEGSVDVPVHNNKRRRESEENTPSKRRKRASRGKAAANRARQIVESDTDEASNMSTKCRSPHYHSDSYPSKPLQNTSRSPRPLKYNFNLEEGKYLEGNERISFLIDKIQEIRKIYMNLKSEVASIDRRRKKLKRREKESASSSAVEVECS